MKLNPSKTRSLVISRSRTDLLRHLDLLVGDVLIPDFPSMNLLGVTLDSRLSFEAHILFIPSISNTQNRLA